MLLFVAGMLLFISSCLFTTAWFVIVSTPEQQPDPRAVQGVLLHTFVIETIFMIVCVMYGMRRAARRRMDSATAVPVGQVIAMSPNNTGTGSVKGDGNGNGNGGNGSTTVQSQSQGNEMNKMEGQEKEKETDH